MSGIQLGTIYNFAFEHWEGFEECLNTTITAAAEDGK